MKKLLTFLKNELIYNFATYLLLLIVWIILFEEISFYVIGTGLFFSALVLWFTDYFLLEDNYHESYHIGIWSMTKYFAFLIVEIYQAGLGVIPNILRGNGDVGYVTCQTKLKDAYLINILANSVTLTPGTVTVHKEEQTLEILAIEVPGPEKDPREVLPLHLESLLLDIEMRQAPDSNEVIK